MVWAIYEPRRLSARVKVLLEDPTSELIVSHATLQELLNKVGRGKLKGAGTSVMGVFARIRDLADAFLPMTVDHIVSAANLPQIHHDPGDRILVAQALAEGVALITIDPEIHDYDVPYIWE